jgi:hypothetical protein
MSNLQLDLFNNIEAKISDSETDIGFDNFEKEMDHFDKLKTQMGFDTVWSMDGMGHLPGLDFEIFTDKPRTVFYRVIDEMDDNMNCTYVTYATTAKNGTLGALWTAANEVYKQAEEDRGDWHYFIEDFVMQDDGSLQLVTGS